MTLSSVSTTAAIDDESCAESHMPDWPSNDQFVSQLKRHSAMVLGVCRRILATNADAEDAAQAVFVLFWQKAIHLQKGIASRSVVASCRSVCVAQCQEFPKQTLTARTAGRSGDSHHEPSRHRISSMERNPGDS